MRRIPAVVLCGLAACSSEELCDGVTCELDEATRAALATLTPLGLPPDDRSNRYLSDPVAVELGRMFFFDPGFSGVATQVDARGRTVPYAADGALKGERVRLSCASCHDLSRGGSDTRSVPNHISVGAGWAPVNARPIINAAHYELPFWNGREDSLWSMILPVVESGLALNGNRVQVVWRIHEHYLGLYRQVFPHDPFPALQGTREDVLARVGPDGACPTEPDGACPAGCSPCAGACLPEVPADGKPGPTAGCQLGSDGAFNDAFDCIQCGDRGAELREQITRVFVNYAKAIAAFEHQLTSRESRFDRWMRGEERLAAEEIRGARLFAGKAACIDCHNTPLFSDNRYHNTGVPIRGEAVPTEADCAGSDRCQAYGVYDGRRGLMNSRWRRIGPYSDDQDDDSRAAYYVEAPAALRGAWRTPSLREVELTAPYMHNGAFQTLEEVVDYYDEGGSHLGAAPENRSPKMVPLGLSPREKADLVAFLKTLTGDPLPESLTTPPNLPPVD